MSDIEIEVDDDLREYIKALDEAMEKLLANRNRRGSTQQPVVMRTSAKWKPWDDSKQDAPAAVNSFNSMGGPPCKWCQYWKPQVKFIETRSGLMYDGVRCCHAEDMNPDFSCFTEEIGRYA